MKVLYFFMLVILHFGIYLQVTNSKDIQRRAEETGKYILDTRFWLEVVWIFLASFIEVFSLLVWFIK
jgi:hypothetical protein